MRKTRYWFDSLLQDLLMPVLLSLRGIVSCCPTMAQASAPPGHIALRWTGKQSVSCALYKSGDTEFKQQVKKWSVDADKTTTVDAAAGDYLLRVLAPGFEAMPIRIQNERTVKVSPKVGQIAFRWNGPDLVICDLFQKNDTEFKQSRGSFYALPGKTTLADTAPGRYLLRIAAPDTPPVSVEVRSGKPTQVGH